MQKIFVVSHTHWDREWYEPFQIFRMRLVRCIDKLLDLLATDPTYEHFLLDGQTVVLEDYLEVRPDRAQTLRDLVRADKIQIGPWYILPDEFLVSGEAIIRNLLRGNRIARDFGGVMQIGYIPDPFGHISQMPQILRGFGIGTAAFRRGLADEPTELWWEAADGTRVLACYLRDGYDNAARFLRSDTGFVENMQAARASLTPHATTENILLLNGTDHMEPWQDLPHLLRVAREKIADAEIVHASLPQYVEQLQRQIPAELCLVRGELRNPKRHHLLPGVASARTWIKQRNARAQVLLEKWAEPFAALAALSNLQPPISNLQLLHTAWKYLLQNQPHDSICGCSIDATHADMAPRFDWVEQIGEALVRENMTALASAVPSDAASRPLVIFNPLAGPRTDVVTTTIEVPGSMEQFGLRDQAGADIPYHIISQSVQEYYHTQASGDMLMAMLAMAQQGQISGLAVMDAYIRADQNPIHLDVTVAEGEPNKMVIAEGLPVIQKIIAENPDAAFEIRAHSPVRFEIEFVARSVPGFGYRAFYVAPKMHQASSVVRARSLELENEFFRVEPNAADGTLTITDKSTGAVYRGINRFVDGGDRGDLYNYCPPESDAVIDHPSAPPEIRTDDTAARQSLVIAANYRLPASLHPERYARGEEMVDERIVTTVSLFPGVPRVDFRVEVDNRARDHRLRVEFPTPIRTDHASAEQAFDVVDRALALPTDTADWIEEPRPEMPMQNFVSASDGKIGLTLASRGLVEYQARPDPEGVTFALTLLRCVGWLSRGDLCTRQQNAGPELETPGAQEIGTNTFEYSLIPHAGDWRNALNEAHGFAAPMRAILPSSYSPNPLSSPLPAGGNGEGEKGVSDEGRSFLTVSSREFVLSAIKSPEEGNGLIVRGSSLAEQPIEVSIELWREFGRAARVNLNEEEIATLELRGGREVRFSARPREIVTVRFE